MLFYGRGAGARPTASAVVSDVVDLARMADCGGMYQGASLVKGEISSLSTILSRYYIRLSINDQPGVLAHVSKILGDYGVSISDVIQKERGEKKAVPLVLLTHEVEEKAVRKAVKLIEKIKEVKGHSQLIRMEG